MNSFSSDLGAELMRQADALAQFSEQAGGITRQYLTHEHRQAGDYLIALMRDAGMSDAGFDCLGNIVGRYAGAGADAPWVITGSHQDTVRDAGKYDGLFGILSPIACIKALHAQGRRLPFGIEVVGFGDEEGVRFGVTLIGSKALAGTFDFSWLTKTDAHGTTLRDALIAFGHWDGSEAAIRALARRAPRYRAFVESHIEQGPVLLNQGLPLGVVTSIVGFNRIRCRVQGVAGHAGTVPMPGRQDALAAACEMALVVERYCVARADTLVGTVGKMDVAQGGAINVIAGEVSFTIDLRSGNDAAREQALADLRAQCEAIAARRKVQLQFESFYSLPAAPCDPQLQQHLADAIAALGQPVHHLPSGAGHDAMAFRGLLPLAMLFLRCGNGGISHNPAEIITADDARLATQALLSWLEHFAV
jgi:hydantoinase/carbamoylase family amidase